MPAPAPLGTVSGGVHRYPVRVYFEDTDLSGVAYHANYLRWMERARSDLLLFTAADQRAAWEAGAGAYAVADLQIRFRAPARLTDDLIVETRALGYKAATTIMGQRVLRADTVLTEATVIAAFVSPDGRPLRQPQAWLESFRALFPPA